MLYRVFNVINFKLLTEMSNDIDMRMTSSLDPLSQNRRIELIMNSLYDIDERGEKWMKKLNGEFCQSRRAAETFDSGG